jgi:hypothetical protein
MVVSTRSRGRVCGAVLAWELTQEVSHILWWIVGKWQRGRVTGYWLGNIEVEIVIVETCKIFVKN